MGIALLLGLVGTSHAADKQPKPLKIAGITTEVEPTRVTVRDKNGGEVTIKPKEDFTEKVAVGSAVTAWYFPGSDTNELQWLEYPLENAFVSPAQFRPQIKRIILLPNSDVQDADGLYEAVEQFLQSRIEWFPAHRMLAEEIRNRAQKANSALKYIDPQTGKMDLEAYAKSHRKLIQRIASTTRVDAVMETRIEVVQVNFRSQKAVWDGVSQPVASIKSRALAFISPLPIDGHVPASTVVLKLYDSQGRLLWSNRRGFCVLALQRGVGDNFRNYSISEALQDQASVNRWLNSVFGSLIPAAKTAPAVSANK